MGIRIIVSPLQKGLHLDIAHANCMYFSFITVYSYKKFQDLIINDDSVTIVIKSTLWKVVMTVVFITRDFVKFVLYLQTNVILSLVAQKGKCEYSKRIRQSFVDYYYYYYYYLTKRISFSTS